MATFVLIHGAWHGGWCWWRVEPELRKRGHVVHAPTLSGLGELPPCAPETITLDTHIDDVLRVLHEGDLRDVILVGHSYGGLVIGGAAARQPERITHLVFLDAYVPVDGRSLMDTFDEQRRTELETWAREEGGGWLIPGPRKEPWDSILRDRYLIDDEDHRRRLRASLRPQPLGTFTQPARAPTSWPPRTYIRCLAYPNAAFDAHAADAARRVDNWRRSYRLKTSHDAMVTCPEALVHRLHRIAADTRQA